MIWMVPVLIVLVAFMEIHVPPSVHKSVCIMHVTLKMALVYNVKVDITEMNV